MPSARSEAFTRAAATYGDSAAADPVYVRQEVSILSAFPQMARIQVPAATATKNITAQRCGNGVRDLDSCRAPSCKKLQASTVRNVKGITSAAEKNAPRAMCSAGVPEK